ncbi:MAG: Ig-like domain-containing protein [Nitrospinota bacterium]|nr:Ig-like domain-containing protein [Nitrospinota bacterium]
MSRSYQIDEDGSFLISNIPIPDGSFRVRFVCDHFGRLDYAETGLLTGVPNQDIDVGPITFGVQAPIPISLNLATTAGTLTPTVLTAQITTTGNLTGGATVDLTPSSTGTFYATSNPAFATVTQEGLVTAVASGTVFITARNEGIVSTIPIQVALSDDKDGDGLPDDYEVANAINPGGNNLALSIGTLPTAHAELSGSEASKAIDGDPNTVWQADTGGSPTFFEVVLPQDFNVAQVRFVGIPAL